ncbi:MAG: hypothetical protein R3A80_05880 [Bdellovibrionota bacterium]
MILSAASYAINGRKGILLFHQKCENASSPSVAQKIFSIFEACYSQVLSDHNSTRIPSSDDMDEPEIQLLENAKARALKSLPQSSLYWGSTLYHVHINSENVFAKLPLWFKLYRFRNTVCEHIELDKSWTKLSRNKEESYLISPIANNTKSRRLIGETELKKRVSFRIADFLSTPSLNIPPSISIDCHLVGDK